MGGHTVLLGRTDLSSVHPVTFSLWASELRGALAQPESEVNTRPHNGPGARGARTPHKTEQEFRRARARGAGRPPSRLGLQFKFEFGNKEFMI